MIPLRYYTSSSRDGDAGLDLGTRENTLKPVLQTKILSISSVLSSHADRSRY